MGDHLAELLADAAQLARTQQRSSGSHLKSWQFSAETYAKHRRHAAWHEALAELCTPETSTRDEDTFFGHVSCLTSPLGIRFARITSAPQRILLQSHDKGDAAWLCLLLEGQATLIDGSRAIRMAAGDIAFGPSRGDAALAMETDFRLLLVRVPHLGLTSRLPGPRSLLTANHIPGGSGVGHVFAGMLKSIAETIDTLTAEPLEPVELALSEFLFASMAGSVAAHAHNGTSGWQLALLQRICQAIETRLGDPNLTLARVAAENGVSTRYLQLLFQSVGESFSHYLRSRRLDRCRADLANPAYGQLSISDVYLRWGFNDGAHFSRAFRKQFGVSPRAWRSAGGERPALEIGGPISRGRPDIVSGQQRSERVVPSEEKIAFRRAPLLKVPAPRKPLQKSAARYHLRATDKTIHWGYFSRHLSPVMEVRSGDIVTIDTLTHHAYDDYDRMIKGDPDVESVFRWTATQKNVDRRGAGPIDASIYGRGAGEGFGVHICTGPVAVRDAQPGDVLEVRILDVATRKSANPRYANRTFGSNAATFWGYHYDELITEPKRREVITIYEVDGNAGCAQAVYNFRWTPQTDPYGVIHRTIDYPGVPVDHATIQEQHGILQHVRVPVRPHFGVIALAPEQTGVVDSVPPSHFGGNLDNWRLGKGASVYLPVAVAGGLLSVGDPHASQGDGELCGTAIECSLTGTFQMFLHKKRDLQGKAYGDLTYPLIETNADWVIHGFSHPNYLVELGENAQSEIYKSSSIDLAMRDAFRKTRRFLMSAKGLSEDEAISLMSVAVDFGVTQVVDGNWGVHAVVRKALFTK